MLIDKVRDIQRSNKQPSILVNGDLMIDHYIWGDATRLSPDRCRRQTGGQRDNNY